MRFQILLITIIIQCVVGREQSVRVTGRLMCHGQPAQYAELQLVSKKIIGGDAFARDVFTTPEGYFEIAGSHDPSFWSNIDARLYIWHRCFEKPYEHQDPCYQWIQIGIPSVNVMTGPLAEKTWDIGQIELKNSRDGQQLDSCE